MTKNRCKPGYKSKDGKCIRTYSRSSKRKKSYNPFKMWLPYILGYFAPSFFVLFDEINTHPADALVKSLFWFLTPGFFDSGKTSLTTLVVVSSGFLLGWAVQSIWRKFK